uniref:Putative pyrophosphatase n=1 Tax=Amycolatopsis sp. SANK 60206 TaxID=1642649 RepID=A0A0E3Z8W3_9PSEU|nr:putative pyrophosphatase [Amycolatopsis sp. SANK 60206]
MDIGSLQRIGWDNKVLKNYNTVDLPLEFCMLQEKASAAFTAWRRESARLGEELADVMLYVTHIAQMAGLDMDHEVKAKVDKNASNPA